MKLVVHIELLPTPDQAAALKATLHACNEAARWVSSVAFKQRVFGKKPMQVAMYNEVKARFGLSAQPALHAIRKVADAYATLRANIRSGNLGKPGSKRRKQVEAKPVSFRPDAAQAFDDRCLSWQIERLTVSMWTTSGRMKGIAFTGSPEQLEFLAGFRRGESDLIHRDGMWFLAATCEVPDAPLNADPVDFLGVDLGIVNIATTSDGEIMAGRELNRSRARERGLRTKLQMKNTPSAKRRLKKRRRKEARRAKDINHKISKHVVAEAERTGRGIALEDLTGIRERVRLRKPQRATHSSWAFAQLGSFIAYKARRAGVPVVYVDPAYTSRTCAECGHIDKANRVSQAWFACRNCGFVDHADRWGHLPFERSREWGRLPQHPRTRVGVVATRGPVNGPRHSASAGGRTRATHHSQWCPQRKLGYVSNRAVDVARLL
ncbi:transposase [Streptomyces sp. SID12488]|uniref:RNA-guided endonuclease InsQ/TnpB family protein n=1 Tax=Streptomyces sp. SID12488 TaxID=2706040 RepID=UPI0031BB7979